MSLIFIDKYVIGLLIINLFMRFSFRKLKLIKAQFVAEIS